MNLFKNFVLIISVVLGVVTNTKGQKMQTPVLLKCADKVIDMKPAYTAPTFLDYDMDGLTDMVVGTYMGNFRFYKNVGSKRRPSYKSYKLILAEGKEAKIHNWWCIAVSPQFVDINGDGNLDLLTASFNGFSYIFNSYKGGGLSAPVELKDEKGDILHLGHYYDSKVRKDWTDDKHQALKRKDLSKEERARIEKMVTDHCCKTKAVDWDNDGDYDLLLIGQRVSLCINKGTKKNPLFSSKKTVIPDLKACTIVDWDGDGLWDILGASKFGGDIYFYKNIGVLGAPKFAKGETILLASDFKSVEGSKASAFQLAAVDYNDDGKLDLVIGSNTSEPRPAPVMTEALIKEKADLEKRYKEVKARRAEISASYKNKYSDPDEYRAEIRKDKEFNDLYAQYGRLYSKILMFSEGITSHGYVWLSLRK